MNGLFLACLNLDRAPSLHRLPRLEERLNDNQRGGLAPEPDVTRVDPRWPEIPHQMDYLFTSPVLAKCLKSCEAVESADWRSRSEYFPSRPRSPADSTLRPPPASRPGLGLLRVPPSSFDGLLSIGLSPPAEPDLRLIHTLGKIELVAEPMCKHRVVHSPVAALALGPRGVIVGRHPVRELGGNWVEVHPTAQLLGTDALRHLTTQLRDVPLLGCNEEDALYPPLPELLCHLSARFGIKLLRRHAGIVAANAGPSTADSPSVHRRDDPRAGERRLA
jgi:hypothetical protein